MLASTQIWLKFFSLTFLITFAGIRTVVVIYGDGMVLFFV